MLHLLSNLGIRNGFDASFFALLREKPMHTSSRLLAFSVLFFSTCIGFTASVPAFAESTGAALPEQPVSAEESLQPVSPDMEIPAELIPMEPLPEQPAQLFSPAIARRFYEIAYQLANRENVTAQQAKQAIVFLSAAVSLDSNADYAVPLLIKLICRYGQGDCSEAVSGLLTAYIDESADREVVNEAARYLLNKLNSREQRETLLAEMLKKFGNKNIIIGSELAANLGMLMAEKTDLEGAQFYLVQAYANNEYNKAAFAKLTQIVPDKLTPAVYLRHLRFALRENPSDIQAAVAFAQYAERLELYDVAASAYEYCANLFVYLYPSAPFPSDIYLPWATCCYNTPLNLQKCIQIAEIVRQSGQFDLLLETVAGKAADKIGDAAEAERMLRAAESKAQQLLTQGPERTRERLRNIDQSQSIGTQKVSAKELAWFYCFALPDPAKALDWANKAYSTEPNSTVTSAILAYSLVMNNQIEWAKPLLNTYQHNQIADLALAKIQLKEGQRNQAVQTLKSLIAKDPGSLAAEQAKEILSEQGAKYVPPVDATIILAALEKAFGRTLVPTFVPPHKLLSVQFNARGNKFSYGSNFDATVAIVNNSSNPLVISDDALFKGNIRVDADVTGDITKSIPNLISTRVRTTFLVAPGQSLLVPVQLVTGELNQLLLAHPQASLDIVFTLYVDPVVAEDGRVANSLINITPAKLSVKRPGIEITGKYLRTRFNSISTGQLGQKIKTAQLFVGLLMEQQQVMAGRRPSYKLTYAEWMPPMLKSALLHESGLLRNPADGEWVVKVNTMADMLSLSLDHDLASAVAESLNSPNWPVRMLAMYLLAQSPEGKFNKVLSWAAIYDTNSIVRNMAIALGGTAPEQPEQTQPLLPSPEQTQLLLPPLEQFAPEPLK